MKNKKFIRNWLVLFLIIGIIGVGIKGFWDYLLAAPYPLNEETQRFIVYKGDSLCGLAPRLEKEQLIRSSKAFCFLAQQNTKLRLETGDFQLSPSMSAKEILTILTSGSIGKWVTLLEGWRVEEIAEKLNKDLGINREEFSSRAKEGYLFPDTYLFEPKLNVARIVQTMNDNFQTKYSAQIQEKIKKQGLTPEEGVILASIVEREARSDEVRRMVASILLKRLRIDMGLNADATIQYLIGYQPEEKSWWKRHLSRDDLKVDSPYNTYLYKGLPPTPICNPSLSSLKAVADATETPYLYYFHDLQGNSYYAKTLEEHNHNVATYR